MYRILVNILTTSLTFYFKKILTMNPENGFHVCEPLLILYRYVVPGHRDSLKGQEVVIIVCNHSIYKVPVSSNLS